MSITSKVLRGNSRSARRWATKRSLWSVQDQTHTDTHVRPWRNSVIVSWGNYVIANPSHWGIS